MKSSLWILGLGRLLQLATVFLAFRVLSSTLSTAEVGFFFFLQAILGVFGLIFVNPVGTFLSREVHGWEKQGNLRIVLRQFSLFTLAVSVMATALVALVGSLRLSSLGTYEPLSLTVIAAFLMVAGSTLANTLIPTLNILERRISFVLLSVFSQAIALGASYVAVTSLQARASLWWSVTGAVQLFFGLIAYRLISKHSLHQAVSPSTEFTTTSKLYSVAWQFGAPIAVANVAVWGLMQGYRPFVENFAGLEALAVVGLGLGIAASVTAAFETLVMQVFLPRFYRGAHDVNASNREQNWNRLWTVSIPSYLALVVSLVVLAPQFVNLLSAENFPMASRYLAIGALAEFARMAGNLIILNAQSERNLKLTRTPYWIGAIVALLGSFLAIQSEDMEIVAWSLVAGQSIATTFLFRNLVNFKMISIPPITAVRFLAIPAFVAYMAKYTLEMNPVLAIAMAGTVIGVLTAHYWWQEERK